MSDPLSMVNTMINKIKQINKIRRPARNSKRKSKQLSPTVITLLDKLTLEEECDLLTGTNKWEVPGCERLDIPEWAVSAKVSNSPSPRVCISSWL